MKSKQNKSTNKSSSNNNKRNKQQLQQQQQSDQKTCVIDDVTTTSQSDDVTAGAMTSSVVECCPAENNSDNHRHSVGGGTDHHVTDKCADDATSDVEVADILQAVTPDPEVTELVTPDVGTELIMAKTFTESTHPEREFVPIRHDTRDDVTDDVSAPGAGAGSLTVRCELQVSRPKTTSGPGTTSGEEGAVSVESCAVGQLRDLTSEMRHLQSLLDDLGSHSITDESSSQLIRDNDDDDCQYQQQQHQQPRVVYRYHLPPATASRRWIRREPSTQHQQHEEVQHGLEHQDKLQTQQPLRTTDPDESTTATDVLAADADESTADDETAAAGPGPGRLQELDTQHLNARQQQQHQLTLEDTSSVNADDSTGSSSCADDCYHRSTTT